MKFIILPPWAAFTLLFGTGLISEYLPFVIGYLAFAMVFQGWIYLLAQSLHLKCRNPPFQLKWVKIAIAFSCIYIVVALILINDSFPTYLIPFHILSMAAIFFSFIFIASTLVKIENEKGINTACKFCVVMMVWFFPIGIWFLQPRVNRVLT